MLLLFGIVLSSMRTSNVSMHPSNEQNLFAPGKLAIDREEGKNSTAKIYLYKNARVKKALRFRVRTKTSKLV